MFALEAAIELAGYFCCILATLITMMRRLRLLIASIMIAPGYLVDLCARPKRRGDALCKSWTYGAYRLVGARNPKLACGTGCVGGSKMRLLFWRNLIRKAAEEAEEQTLVSKRR